MSAPENEKVSEFVELLRALEVEIRDGRKFKRRLLPLLGALYHHHKSQSKEGATPCRSEYHRELTERLEKALEALKARS